MTLDKFASDPMYRGLYAGHCYDGPLEGQWKTSNSCWFSSYAQNYISQPLSEQMSQTRVAVHSIHYRWSNPLRAWVWQQK